MTARLVGALGLSLLFACTLPTGCSSFHGNDDAPAGDPDAATEATDGGTDGAVTGMADKGLTIQLGPPTAYIIQGSTVGIPVTLTRHQLTQGAVAVTASGLPAKVTADPLTIAAGQLMGTLTLHAEQDAVQGVSTVMVKATETGALTLGNVDVFVRGAPGALDTTFGTQGANLHMNGGGDSVHEAAILADGSILFTGQQNNVLTVTKLTKDGKVDTTFGNGTGSVAIRTTQGGSEIAVFERPAPATPLVYILNEGNGDDATLYRLNIDGSLDLTFNGVGSVAIADGLTGKHKGQALAVTAEGKALVMALTGTTSRLTRRNLDGSLDSTFGPTGYFDVSGGAILVLRLNGGLLLFQNLTPTLANVYGLLPTGAGDSSVGPPPTYFTRTANSDFVVRGPDGSLVYLETRDPTGNGTKVYSFERVSATLGRDPFGLNGTVDLPLKSTVRPLVEADNSILFASEDEESPTPPLAIMHYLKNGQPDTAFGNAGIATFTFSEDAYLHSAHMNQQPDGRIVVLAKNDIGPFTAAMFRFWQ